MSSYSIAEARSGLPRLIDKALAGERVVITRRGQAVAEINPTRDESKKNPRAGLEWLAERRKTRPSLPRPSLEILQEMKDEKPW
jgi:antitoxin (DNA-binding transcriptional repressor) of toxin-antitoxin stability system